jgi:hypothetical protein
VIRDRVPRLILCSPTNEPKIKSLGSSLSRSPTNFEESFATHHGATRCSTHWPSRGHEPRLKGKWKMDDFNSETDSDYTSYWRDWVSLFHTFTICAGVSKVGADGSR